MDLMQIFMNFVAPPISFITLLLVMPLYFFFKFSHYMLRSIFSENLAGKVVLITGASSGIGEALAYQYAKRGAHLVLVARRKNALQEVAERARSCGSGDVLVIRADVSDVDDCKRFIDKAVGHFGRLDHLVTNAGITSVTMVEDSTNITNFRALMDTNFWGSVYPTYFAIPHLKKSRGKIAVTASVARWLPAPRLAFYNASKAAVAIFYEALRSELGSDIGITIVTPGLVESEMTKGKFFTNEGKMEVDQELRDVEVGPVPVMYVADFAKAVISRVCIGAQYVRVPSWYDAIFLWQVLCPEVVELVSCLFIIPKPGAPIVEALNKKILDATEAKYFLYLPSLLSPEIKQDYDHKKNCLLASFTMVGLGPTPVMHVEDCANAIVNSVCKGDRNVVVPSWYNIIHLWQMFCPEVVEWFLRLMVIPMPGQPNREALNKKITDATGAKNFLYPPSILSPDIKQD